MVYRVLIIFGLSFLTNFLYAQEAIPTKISPLAMTTARYKDAYIKITYSQPHKRGRQVFGGLVPYGTVWRLGANEATEITTTRDIQVNGKVLKAGTYSLFAIPEQAKWTIIINAEVGLWGSYNYNNKLDIMRFDVPVQVVNEPVYEPLTLKIDQSNESANLLILWDRVRVAIPFKFMS
jgi:hypothetical protein